MRHSALSTTSSPGRVLLVGVVCFALWTLIDAPRLARSTESATLGPQREVALALLRPLSSLQETIVAGRASGSVPPSPTVRPQPTPSATGAIEASPAAPSPRTPTAADPLRVLVVGDSIATDLGHALAELAPPELHVVVDAHPATGLSRPDYFDWPARLAVDLRVHDPDLVVVMLGVNDAQPFLEDAVPLQTGTSAWEAAYAMRVDHFMQLASSGARRVLWLGLPVMRDDAFSELMSRLNAIYAARAAEHAAVRYFATWPLFADGRGRYAAFLPDETGTLVSLRQTDGIHFSVAGADRLAVAVLAAIAMSSAAEVSARGR